MNLQGAQPLQETQACRLRSQEYLRNAYVSLERIELEKADKFGWGAMAQAVKAVAALKVIELRQHRDLGRYARDLAEELRDYSIFQNFRQADALYRNFYEAGLQREEVSDSLDSIRNTVAMLLRLLPEEVHQK